MNVDGQRLAVAQAIFFSGEHLSAEMAREHDFGDGFKRYEPDEAGAGRPHDHCVCSACGSVTEFSNDRLERMIALLAEEAEFRPHHHRLEIYGLCRRCQQLNPLARAR